MNSNYLIIIDKITAAKVDIERLWHEAQKADLTDCDDRSAYRMVENLIENLDLAKHRLKRLSAPVVEGFLCEDKERGKFRLIRYDTGNALSWEFSCGDYLEVLGEDKEWYIGRVEHTSRDNRTGYYFHNADLKHPFLYDGMVCRIREDF